MAFGTIAAGIGLGLSALSTGANIFRGFPEFPISESDINKQIDLQLNRALSEIASGTRRRLVGSGQGGSGTINQAIQDNQSRVRSMFEGERVKALNLLKQAQFGRDVQAFNQLGQTLEGLTSIGFSAFQLGSGFGLNNQQQFNPSDLSGIRNNISGLQQLNTNLPGLQQGQFQGQQIGGFNPNTSSFGANNLKLGIQG